MHPHTFLSSAISALLASSATATHHHHHLHRSISPRTQCYSGVFVLVSRGSEEPQGQSVLEGIAGAIIAAVPNSGSNEVVYPALLSFWDSAPTGVDDAQQQMQQYVTQCPNGKMILLGYSQGSYVLANALAGGNFSDQSWPPIADDVGANIAAIVLFGDQARVPGVGTYATGTNCAEVCTASAPLALTSPYNASMAAYSDRLEEWCDVNDPICCSTGNDISAHLGYWSDNTTDTVVQFVQGKLGTNTSTSSASSSTTSSTSLSPASSSALSSSALSAASSVESAVSTKSAELAAATDVSVTGSGTAATTQGPSSTTATISQSAGAASTSDGSRPLLMAIYTIYSVLVCATLLGLSALA